MPEDRADTPAGEPDSTTDSNARPDSRSTDEPRINRRGALRALGAGAGVLAGIGHLSGTALAWERFDVCFKGCRTIWMIVGEEDVKFDPPTVAHVIVASNGETECRPVKFTEKKATTKPKYFGDAPVVTFHVKSHEKILGVLEYDYNDERDEAFDDPMDCVYANPNACAEKDDLPDLHDARCVPDDHDVCSPSKVCKKLENGDNGNGDNGNGDNGNGDNGNGDNGNGECVPCETEGDLLVKYEWNTEEEEFDLEGSDENITLEDVTLDDDDEPEEACFSTDYCEVDAVVKAGQDFETYEDESGEFCVTGIEGTTGGGGTVTRAISNVQFFCVAPDEPGVGNSSITRMFERKRDAFTNEDHNQTL